MRFGIGWRPELAAGILANLDRIEVVEILAEEHFGCGRAERRALRFLRSQVPVVVHATSLGLASTERVDGKRLDALARLVEWLEPELWSEHLAFVRHDGHEVGHLAAPPRNDATLAGLARNVEEATRVVGSAPLLENVASLVDPPFSTYDEAGWLVAVTEAVTSDLVVDLHNLHANAVNFGFRAEDVVRAIPPQRIGGIHLAGGRRIERGRVLDDHLHAVPEEVYELLAYVHAPSATVILERDGRYPPFEELLSEVERARSIVPRPLEPRAVQHAGGDTAVDAIPFLAQIHSDPVLRARFIAAPYEVARARGFDHDAALNLAAIDAEDLAIAGNGFDRKRAHAARSLHR